MDPKALARIERTNYVITAIVLAFSAVVLGKPYALGLGIGSLLGSVNFSLIRKQVQVWTRAATEGHAGGSAYLFIPKMIGLIAIVFLAISYLPLSAAAFAIGFSTFFLSIAIETVRFTTSK